jgi:AcrR family transcriptional regulator
VAVIAEPQPALKRGEGREALLRAIVRIVARDGVDGLTYRAVAAEAGVTHGLASYHFSSRETMLKEALAWATAESIEHSHLDTAAGSLDELASDVPDLIARNPESAAFQFAMALHARQRPEFRVHVRALYDKYIGAVQQSLAGRASADPVLSRLVFAAIDGLVLQQLIYNDEEATRESLDRLRQLLESMQTSTLDPSRP